MAILDWVKELPLSAVLKERLVDSEKQVSALEHKSIDLEAKVLGLEQDKLELASRLQQSEQNRRALEKRIVEIHSITLNEKHKSVLLAVASRSGAETLGIAEYAGISESEALEKLSYLESHFLVSHLTRHRTIPDPGKPRGIPQKFFTWTVVTRGHACINYLGLQERIT